ncbi:hypothetical protein, partial [Flavobacterium sp.]|uniref:hypothetical protein n=1 Tax=Flavobacterium sp. TaxID=239 RepID=UPI00260A8336
LLLILSFLISCVFFMHSNANDFRYPGIKVVFVFLNLSLCPIFFGRIVKKSTISKEQKLLFYAVPVVLLEYLGITMLFYFYKTGTIFFNHLVVNGIIIVFAVFIIYYTIMILKQLPSKIGDEKTNRLMD